MPPPIDPALGLSGALTALQQQPPMTAAANLPAADGGGGGGGEAAAHMSRAARSLESVQGNVAGQSMAIQQMSMSGAQQSTNLQMLISQLGTQVSGLMQAVQQLTTSTRMSASGPPGMGPMGMPAPMSMPPPPVSGGMGGGFAGAGAMAMAGGSMAAQGLSAAGGAFGRMGGAMAQPFLGAPIHQASQGMFGPQLGADTGFLRSAGLATGLGIHPEMMKTAGASQIQQLGRENMQQRFGDTALAGIGGASRFGAAIIGEAAGTGMAGAMGMSGIGGMVGGMAMGAGVGAIAGAGINEVMGQTASMRGFGDQFARNSFRFMPPESQGFGSSRKPDMGQRLQVGKAMNRSAIDDLSFNEQDMSEMFAGMSQQDLMRGVQSVDEVVSRFRETKETFKMIGRRMGQGIQEASGTMGALQGLGFDSTGQRGRAAIFGASSVMGLTPGEAMGRSTGFAQQFSGQGTGREMLGVSNYSQQIAQSAIGRGAMSNVDIAALGGREGAGQSMAQLQAQFMESSIGKAAMVAGSRGVGKFAMGDIAGLNPQQLMAQAGRRGSANVGIVAEVGMGGAAQMQEMLKDPVQAQAFMLSQIRGLSKQFEGQPGVTPRLAMKMAMKSINPQATDAQMNAMLNQFEHTPQALKDRQTTGMRTLTEAQHDDAAENAALFSRGKRAIRQTFTPAAETFAGGVTNLGSSLGRAATNIERSIQGTEVLSLGSGIDPAAMSALRERGSSIGGDEDVSPEMDLGARGGYRNAIKRNKAQTRNRIRQEQKDVMGADVNEHIKGTAQQMVKSEAGNAKNRAPINEAKRVLRNPDSSPDDKRDAINKLMSTLSGGTYDSLPVNSKDPATRKRALGMRKAFQQAIEAETGFNVSSHLIGSEHISKSFGEKERGEMKDLRGDVANLLELDDDSDAAAFARPEIGALIKAMDNGGDIAGTRKAAIEAGLQTQVDKIEGIAAQEGTYAGYGLPSLLEMHKFNFGAVTTPMQRLSKAAQLMKGGGGKRGLNELEGMEGTQNRLKEVIGKGLGGDGGILSQLRSRGLGDGTAGLTEGLGGDASSIISSLGKLPGMIGEEELDALETGGISGGRNFAKIIRGLKGVDASDGINRSEREAMASVLDKKADSEFMNKLVKDVTKAGDIGAVVAMAMDATTPTGTSVLGRKGQGITDAQAKDVYDFMQSSQLMAEQVRQIADIVKDLKKGG